MTTALSAAYPSGSSLPSRVFGPVFDPVSYLRATHLLLMFPLGVAYFVFFVTTLAFGGALVWTFIGPPVLLLAMYVSLWIGDAEAALTNFVTKSEIRRPPQGLEGVTSLRDRVWSRIIDPSTWTGLLYALVQFPVGVAGFVLVVCGFTVAGAFIASPVLAAVGDGGLEIGGESGFVIDSPLEAAPLVVLGLLAWLLTVHLIVVFSALHATWARLMLGSRGRRPPAGSNPAPQPTEPPPLLLLPPGGHAVNEADAAPDTPAAEAANEHPVLNLLTAREREVVKLLARGYSNADICEICYISEGTVKTHVRNILAKLELRDRTQVAVFAYESGLIRPGSWRAARAEAARALG
jgi:DNA-binding CsgD family transcriptional regulator